MVDYRLLKDEENRKLLKFGWFAGVAGTVDFLRGIGEFLLNKFY
jgi:hypothetical protein